VEGDGLRCQHGIFRRDGLNQFLVGCITDRRAGKVREPERGKRLALIDRVAKRAALTVVRDLAMEFPMQGRVVLDVQV
jgi:hypothetical protein